MAERSYNKPAEIFRKYYSQLCKFIGLHPDVCIVVACELFSHSLIPDLVKNDVVNRARSANVEVAAVLMEHLRVKLEDNPDLWEKTLDILDNSAETLEPIIKKMRSDSDLESTGSEVALIQKTISRPFEQVVDIMRNENERDIHLNYKINKLRTHFQNLVIDAKYGVKPRSIDDIQLFLTAALSSYNSPNSNLDKYIEDIKKQESIHDLIEILLRNNFCGYLNYQILADLITTFGNQKCKESLKKYEEEYVEFAKEFKIAELVKKLDTFSIIGFPTIMFEVGGSWMTRAFYTFQQAISSTFSSTWRFVLSMIGKGSVVITYSIFPEDFPTVMRDWKVNEEFLRSLGIRVLVDSAGMDIEMQRPNQQGAIDKRNIDLLNEHVTSLDLLISEHKRKNSQLSKEIKGHDELSPLERKLLEQDTILVKSLEQDINYLKIFFQGMILSSASTASTNSRDSNSSDRVDSGLGTLSPINPSTIPSMSFLSPDSSPEVKKASTISLTKTPSQSPLLHCKMANHPEKQTIKFESPKFNYSKRNPSPPSLPADDQYLPMSLSEPKTATPQTTQKKKKSKRNKSRKRGTK